jgi:hypothetical protein
MKTASDRRQLPPFAAKLKNKCKLLRKGMGHLRLFHRLHRELESLGHAYREDSTWKKDGNTPVSSCGRACQSAAPLLNVPCGLCKRVIFGRITRDATDLTVLNRCSAAFRPRFHVIRRPILPFTFSAIALKGYLAVTAIPPVYSQPLLVGKESLVILQFDIRHSFKEFPEQILMAPS